MGCESHKLGEPSVVEARLYTLHRGILPAFSKSLYCRRAVLHTLPQMLADVQLSGCFTRYYHNYSVQKASDPLARNVYYDEDVPPFIHVTDTCFIEKQLCVYFETQMAISQYVWVALPV